MPTNGRMKRIGILTGGGDCPGLNAVIRVVTKAAITQFGYEVFGIEDGFLGLIRNRMHPLNMQDVSNILTVGGTILGTSNSANPSKFAIGKDEQGKPVFEDVTGRVIEHVKERHLDAIVCIGGDGTMSGAAELIKRGVPCVGVPKTIDNDLMHTDITFGFQTAVETATECLDRIHTTASSHHRVMVVELMGRNAGWLTLHAGVASGADVIVLPEIPYNIDAICAHCIERSKRGKRFTIIAISEGAMPRGGKQVIDKIVADSPDPIRLGGISQVLADQIEQQSGLVTRATILGHIQRGGTPIAADRVLAMQFGHHAIELVAEGQFGNLVVMQNAQIRHVPISEVADQQRTVPLDDPLLDVARSVGTCLGEAE
jgi:phosphofructokinase-like protein